VICIIFENTDRIKTDHEMSIHNLMVTSNAQFINYYDSSHLQAIHSGVSYKIKSKETSSSGTHS